MASVTAAASRRPLPELASIGGPSKGGPGGSGLRANLGTVSSLGGIQHDGELLGWLEDEPMKLPRGWLDLQRRLIDDARLQGRRFRRLQELGPRHHQTAKNRRVRSCISASHSSSGAQTGSWARHARRARRAGPMRWRVLRSSGSCENPPTETREYFARPFQSRGRETIKPASWAPGGGRVDALHRLTSHPALSSRSDGIQSTRGDSAALMNVRAR